MKKYNYSDEPIRWGTFKRKLKYIITKRQIPLVIDWLINNKYIAKGEKNYYPIEKGLQNGFYTEIRESLIKSYFVMYLNRHAQELVINNLDTILSRKNSINPPLIQTKQSHNTKVINKEVSKKSNISTDTDDNYNCKNCMLYRNEECIGTRNNTPCEDFRYAVKIDRETFESWPDEGTASNNRFIKGKKYYDR